MTDNEIIKSMQCVIGNDANCSECTYQKVLPFPSCRMMCAKNALDLINRQKAEIERLKKNYEELIYKTECLLCHATGNKFSKYTYTTQEMISFVDDYIQDCCDEVIEETKATAKSEAIKEFAERLKEKLQWDVEFDNKPVFESDIDKEYVPIIDNLVKEMTEVEQ